MEQIGQVAQLYLIHQGVFGIRSFASFVFRQSYEAKVANN